MIDPKDFVVVEQHDCVGLIRLNRPEKLNAWTVAMRDTIMKALNAFEADPAIRAVVLTGTGERAFCAGQDLEEAHGFSVDEAEVWIRGWETFYSVLRGLSKPLIMALNGTAAGSAFQACLMGDIRVGHAGVRMGQPEINSGIASITGPWIMNQMLGMSRTIELTLTGRLMDAEESQRIGLIHHLVEREDVLKRSMDIARDGSQTPGRDETGQGVVPGDDRHLLQGSDRGGYPPPSRVVLQQRAATHGREVLRGTRQRYARTQTRCLTQIRLT